MTKTVSKLSAVILAGVIAIATFSLYTFEAAAFHLGGGGDDDRTIVRIDNHAKVTNDVSVTANTGGNTAEGGSGGEGGDGGNAFRGDGGNGGRGGNGSDGGTVTTGPATAIGTVDNEVNRTIIDIEGCGCDDDKDMDRFSRFFNFNNDSTLVRVDTTNHARVGTTLDVVANTGRNSVDGGNGGEGGDGGNARDNSRRSWFAWFWQNQDNNGGNGGNGSAGGGAGTVRTGTAFADGLVTNVIDRTIVRIENGDDDPMPPVI